MIQKYFGRILGVACAALLSGCFNDGTLLPGSTDTGEDLRRRRDVSEISEIIDAGYDAETSAPEVVEQPDLNDLSHLDDTDYGLIPVENGPDADTSWCPATGYSLNRATGTDAVYRIEERNAKGEIIEVTEIPPPTRGSGVNTTGPARALRGGPCFLTFQNVPLEDCSCTVGNQTPNDERTTGPCTVSQDYADRLQCGYINRED